MLQPGVRVSFFKAESYSLVWISHICLISSIRGLTSYFHFGAAASQVCVMIYFLTASFPRRRGFGKRHTKSFLVPGPASSHMESNQGCWPTVPMECSDGHFRCSRKRQR